MKNCRHSLRIFGFETYAAAQAVVIAQYMKLARFLRRYLLVGLWPSFESTIERRHEKHEIDRGVDLCRIYRLGPPPSAASANIIDTTYGAGAGSFELGGQSGAAFDSLATGSTVITGWTVGGPGDGVDWLSQPSFNASAGNLSADLQSSFASSISTVISTVIGQTYQLTFDATAVDPLQQAGTVSAGALTGQAYLFSTAIVSEPGTLVLFGIGFVGLMLRRSNRKTL